jgi:branched-chain amino acid transport system substrate-binding protein
MRTPLTAYDLRRRVPSVPVEGETRFRPASWWRAATALAVALLLASLSVAPGDARQRSAQANNQIVVGSILDLARGWTSLGRASRVTLQLAAADANAAFARSGSSLRVRLRIVDARGEPALAQRRLRRLAASGVHVVVGPQASSEVAALRRAAASLGVVVISQGSTAHSLAIAGDNVLRFVPDDVREGEALVALLRHDRVDAIVPVWRRDAGNEGLARSVRRQFSAKGGKVSEGIPYAATTTNFTAVASLIAAQAATLRTAGAKRIGVYLAGFDEVVDLFHAARLTPTLQTYPWYGSDGVALSTRLVGDKPAAAFADAVGYPNPTVGLSDAAVRKARPVVARARKSLGRSPDALAITAYDALRIAVVGERRASGRGGARLRRAIVAAANAHAGITGTMRLNRAGDRAYGNFDFWSVCARGAKFGWVRSFDYAASRLGSGRIVTRRRC